MTKSKTVILAALVVAGIAAGGFAAVRGKAPASAPAAQPVVEFTQRDLYIVEPRALERTLPLTGTLSPLTEATVKAKVAGELVEVAVREGESVRQGQVLARIDPTEVRARVAAREADVAAARAQLVWADKNRSTQKALLDKAFISQNAFDNIQSNYDVAVAKLRSAEAELIVARKSLGDSVLVAPFPGIVAQRHVQPGERVALDAKVITVVNLSRLELEAAVPAAEISRLRVGQEVAFSVDGFGERAFGGRIERINPGTVSGSRSINVYAVIDNPEGVLRGGLFAQGAVSLERVEGALVVPASAVREEIGQTFVYAIEAGLVKRKNVTVGAPDASGRVQVLQGLAAGERIVRVNLGALRARSPQRRPSSSRPAAPCPPCGSPASASPIRCSRP
jgi:RND family efflux transporter MFP subunit